MLIFHLGAILTQFMVKPMAFGAFSETRCFSFCNFFGLLSFDLFSSPGHTSRIVGRWKSFQSIPSQWMTLCRGPRVLSLRGLINSNVSIWPNWWPLPKYICVVDARLPSTFDQINAASPQHLRHDTLSPSKNDDDLCDIKKKQCNVDHIKQFAGWNN